MYEDIVRSALPGILWNAYKLPIGIAEAGANRKFNKSSFLGVHLWPIHIDGVVEVDFWVHSPDLPVDVVYGTLTVSTNTNITLFKGDLSLPALPPIAISNASASDIASTSSAAVPSSSTRLSPEKETNPENNVEIMAKYVLGEITMGGKTSVSSKLIQLEKDICIAMAKLGCGSPLDAVSLACVANPFDNGQSVSKALSAESTHLTHLRTLYRHGRVAFVQYKGTPMQALFEGQAKLFEGQAELVEGQAELVEGQAELVGRQAELVGRMDELVADVGELKANVGELKANVGELKDMMLLLMQRFSLEKDAK